MRRSVGVKLGFFATGAKVYRAGNMQGRAGQGKGLGKIARGVSWGLVRGDGV